jgi:hypothetical protein
MRKYLWLKLISITLEEKDKINNKRMTNQSKKNNDHN